MRQQREMREVDNFCDDVSYPLCLFIYNKPSKLTCLANNANLKEEHLLNLAGYRLAITLSLSFQIHICRAMDGQCGMETETERPLKKPNLIEDEDRKLILVPSPPEELYSCGKLMWEWYTCEEEDHKDESPSDIVYYVFESDYNVIKAGMYLYD